MGLLHGEVSLCEVATTLPNESLFEQGMQAGYILVVPNSMPIAHIGRSVVRVKTSNYHYLDMNVYQLMNEGELSGDDVMGVVFMRV